MGTRKPSRLVCFCVLLVLSLKVVMWVVQVGDIVLIHSEKLNVWPFGTMGSGLLRLIRNEWNQVAHKLAAASFHVIVPWIL